MLARQNFFSGIAMLCDCFHITSVKIFMMTLLKNKVRFLLLSFFLTILVIGFNDKADSTAKSALRVVLCQGWCALY